MFVDWRQSGDLSWGATGQALQECYRFDSWKITAGSYGRFVARMKALRKGLPERCLASIWAQAQSSCKAPVTASQRAVCSDQLAYLWELWSRYERRRHYLGEHIVELVDRLDPAFWIPPFFSGFTELMRAKILAEIRPAAPLSSLAGVALAYAGLKIRMRQSRTYRGQDKITKK